MRPGRWVEGQDRTFIEAARRAQIVTAAIDTIAEVGYAGASFARIAERLGISRGLISYHFAGKEDLMRQVVHEAAEEAKAYIAPRVLSQSTGPAMLSAYIESNLAFMRDHRNNVVAMIGIARSSEAGHVFHGDADVVNAVSALEHGLSDFQKVGQLRSDFDPRVMAVAIRATIDAASSRLAMDPAFDLDHYSSEITTTFLLATTIEA